MIYECKVFDKDGNLKKTHTVEELEDRSTAECLSYLPATERQIIETFGNYKRGDDSDDITHTLLFY